MSHLRYSEHPVKRRHDISHVPVYVDPVRQRHVYRRLSLKLLLHPPRAAYRAMMPGRLVAFDKYGVVFAHWG